MKKIGIHLGIMLVLTLTMLLLFFYNFLPSYTNHGETITVPDLNGMAYQDLEEYLLQRELRFEVEQDSGYSADLPSLTVLKQYPLAGSKVKANRKLFVNLNKTTPRKVMMPNLIDGSVKSAQMVLESYGLEVGNIEYRPDLAQNAVLEQRLQGSVIEPGDSIYQGSKVDLIVGDGLGNQMLEVPALFGMDFEDAEFTVIGSGLRLGSILTAQPVDSLPTGAVIKQIPAAGESIRIGQDIDLWVIGYNEETQKVDYGTASDGLNN
jgi:beta-lactam-binding protein with PASTA domain